MSKGDQLFGIETMYKNINFRSILETKIAFFLDSLKIKWEYEPKTFMLSSGIIYKPDFYLSELKMWLEVKGDIKDHNKEISKQFVIDNQTEILLISSNETFWFSVKDWDNNLCEDKHIYLGKCSNCNSFFFASNMGTYFCRKCKNHEGDHDLISWLNDLIPDFSNLEEIKKGLKKCKNNGKI